MFSSYIYVVLQKNAGQTARRFRIRCRRRRHVARCSAGAGFAKGKCRTAWQGGSSLAGNRHPRRAVATQYPGTPRKQRNKCTTTLKQLGVNKNKMNSKLNSVCTDWFGSHNRSVFSSFLLSSFPLDFRGKRAFKNPRKCLHAGRSTMERAARKDPKRFLAGR